MKKIFLLFISLAISSMSVAQNIFSGIVISSNTKKPLFGATVVVKNYNLTTSTDTNGVFVFKLPQKQINIIVSNIGYKEQQTIFFSNQEGKIIRMNEDISTLKEVVVSTGYQELPKERATGSFTKVTNRVFNQQVTTDVLSRLEGVTNGLSVDRNSTSPGIMVRGLSTIQGISGALIVLDNFPYEGDINNINPNDVESVTVLKDAAAASIWGTKAGNGVIVITTKKGSFNQPLVIDFNANVTFGNKPDLGYAKQMASTDYIGVEKMLFSQGFYDSQINSPYHPALSPVVELLQAAKSGTITNAQANSQINTLANHDIRSDFEKYVYRPLTNQQYSLNLHGGTEQMSWTASGGYDNNISNLDEKYNRANLRYQNNIKLLKQLEISTDLYYTQSNSTSGKIPYGNPLYSSYPYSYLADSQGNPVPVARDYSLSYLQGLGSAKLLDWKYYPLTDYKSDLSKVKIQDLLANFNLRYHIIPGLDADLKYQYERQQSTNDQHHDQGSYFTRNLINSFTQFDASGNPIYKIPLGAIYDEQSSVLTSQNLRGQISYNQTWGKNNITAIAGGEVRNAQTNTSLFRNYGVNPSVLTTGSVDYTTAFPNYITGNTDYIPNPNGLATLTNRFVSVFSNAAYTYNNKYIVSISGRRDASNLFGVNTNDKWTPLWSAGAGWNVSNEPFYKIDWLPYLKLRTTYGYSGNVDQSQSGVTIINSLATSVYTGTPYARIEKYANPDLRWEKVGMLNLGIDFSTKDNRIAGSIEYYHKKGVDLFGTAVLDYTSGIGSTIIKNVASMQGNGFDLELNTVNIKGAVRWTSNINFSTYHDKVTAYYEPSLQGSNFVGNSSVNAITGLVGKPVYSILSYKWAGLDPQTGDPRGFINGQISKDYTALIGASTQVSDLVYSGSALPTVFGSFGNTISYKTFSLTARLLYKFGYYFRKSSIHYNALFNYGIGHSDFAKRWQKPGDETSTNVPSMIYPASSDRDSFYDGSEVNVDKGDNIRLQYITLSYEINNHIVKRLPFERLVFYVSASNLGIIWRANKDGIDPDYPISFMPPVKNISFGIRGTF